MDSSEQFFPFITKNLYYSHNHRRMGVQVVRVDQEVRLVPWDLEAQPAPSALVYPSVLGRPENPKKCHLLVIFNSCETTSSRGERHDMQET